MKKTFGEVFIANEQFTTEQAEEAREIPSRNGDEAPPPLSSNSILPA